MSATAQEIADTLDRLRSAGTLLRQRRREDVVETLGQVLESLRDRGLPSRKRLEAELPAATGFTPQVVRAGLDLGLADWTAEAFRTLAEDALAGSASRVVSGFDTTAVFLGGALPMPTLLTLLAPLLLGSPVLAKTSQHDPATAHILARAVAEVDPGLGACLEVLSFPGSDTSATDALLRADCVVATGSDATIASIAARVRPPRRFVGYGHRVSVAVVGAGSLSGAALAETARGVALDVALWDQLGCLSPVAIFVVGRASPLAEALATELERLTALLPRGHVPKEAEVAIAHARVEAEMRAASGRRVTLHGSADGDWMVVAEADARIRPAPLHRFVRVHPVGDVDALLDALRPLGSYLAGVAVTGFGPATHDLAQSLAALGASRICVPGRLQAPPLGWHHDGQPVLPPLARFSDVELV